ncbi:MAG TPA: DUF1987 domain-containing protein [Rariglobus sp.]
MKPLAITPTDTTPAIDFDAAAGVLRFSGESYPENVSAFYEPVLAWVREALAERIPLKVVMSFGYLNTSSTKAVLDLLLLLDDHHRDGGRVEVEWHYNPALEVMQEAGEEFGEDLALPYRLVPIT